jgi:ABC-type sugar transport system ATPase subunit
MTTDSTSTSESQEGARSASAGRAPDLSRAESANGPAPDALLSIRGVSKHFGPVLALDDINLDAPAGQVTALLGDNGAGKSTLIKIIAGIHEADGGTIYWDGKPVHVRTPHDATALGIATVYQDLALCDNLDIVANMYLGEELGRFGILNESPMERKARETLAGLSVTSVRSIRQPVGSLSGGQRQGVAVARAAAFGSRVVIMDEPTAALGVPEQRKVMELIAGLKAQGVSVLLISHNLHDIFAVADRIAVLRRGEMAGERLVSQTTGDEIVHLMVGDTYAHTGGASH